MAANLLELETSVWNTELSSKPQRIRCCSEVLSTLERWRLPLQLSAIKQDCFTADLLSGICKIPDCRLRGILGSSLTSVIFSLFQHTALISFDSVVLCCTSVFYSVNKEPEQNAECFRTKCFCQVNLKLLDMPPIVTYLKGKIWEVFMLNR